MEHGEVALPRLPAGKRRVKGGFGENTPFINNVSGKGCKKESGLCVLRPGTHSLTQKRDMRRDSRT